MLKYYEQKRRSSVAQHPSLRYNTQKNTWKARLRAFWSMSKKNYQEKNGRRNARISANWSKTKLSGKTTRARSGTC